MRVRNFSVKGLRFGLVIIAGILAISLLLPAQAPIPMQESVPQQYARYNTKWFGNRLPQVPVTYDSALDEHALWGVALCDPTIDEKIWTPKAIKLHPDLERPFMRKPRGVFLLHEMVHLDICMSDGNDFGHGDAFQQKMRGLAARGAFDELW